MKLTSAAPLLALACALTLSAADPQTASMSGVFDRQFTNMEHELVPLAGAMPADKYSFAPTAGEFKGARTFGQQMSHIATVLYEISAQIMNEKCPVNLGQHENGAASMTSKEAGMKYLLDAVAYSHKALKTLTAANFVDMVPSPFPGESTKIPRGTLATILLWHTYDHYGQSVIYVRMNGIVPPASRPQ